MVGSVVMTSGHRQGEDRVDRESSTRSQINVETKQGVVQLNGYVDNASEKQAAEATAKSVAGVASVANNLQVRAGERSTGTVVDDATITTRVKSALIADERTKAYKVDVKTYKGVVS
jgi:hyperosmotically inducible protein